MAFLEIPRLDSNKKTRCAFSINSEDEIAEHRFRATACFSFIKFRHN